MMDWKHRRQCCAAAASIVLLGTAIASSPPPVDRLTDLTLEELSNIEIISVSKRAERLSDAPQSVFVITSEDIRRAGAKSLPEALRLAPNLHVARSSATGWSISARGFNSLTNKLLVLIDGRSVYTPLYSGVFWDVQDLLLEDVERIEVISGPGGTLWGVNAVNGVVNVITRSAEDTQGRLITAGVGNREAQLALRQGGRLHDEATYRVYAKQTRLSDTQSATGSAVNDSAYTTQIGFRADWGKELDVVTLQGDAYRGKRDQPMAASSPGIRPPITVSGVNLLTRWDRVLSPDSSVTAQAIFDHIERAQPPLYSEILDIVDLQLQHAWRPSAEHDLVWGGQYRYAMDQVTNSSFLAFLPNRVNQAWASFFVQDEIALSPKLRAVLGARVEHNVYTGYELLPNARLAWKLDTNHLLWGAVSRTVRAPSRLDRDFFVPGQEPYQLAGGPNFRSEIAEVYEAGYRGQPSTKSFYSLTLYQADYDHLRTLESAPGSAFFFLGNGMKGTLRGLEMWGSYQALPNWRLHAGFSRLWQDLRLKPGSTDTARSVASIEGVNPAVQWNLRSTLDLPRRVELDMSARYVSELKGPPVDSYWALDLRCAWRPSADTEVSMSGKNLLGTAHEEFPGALPRTAFSRTVLFEWVQRF